ncbi:MAG: APC family permease [bacterium]|nr:APC family permease [bacterium]
MQKGNYGLFTAITMIAGIVIGSGIFFKSDDVLLYTNGSVFLGTLVFVIAALAIIFGCLAISQLATRTDNPGGIIAYAEEFVNDKVASAFGWFQSFLYLPTLVAVVGTVSGMYACQLFGIQGNNVIYCLIGFGAIVMFFVFNMLSARFGGAFQNASMIIKLIPLLLIGILGFVYGKPGDILVSDVEMIRNTSVGTTWLAAFAPIAFSFDGWIVATSVSHEIRNSKRNLPIALICAPIVILVAYLTYFIGITSLVGPETVLAQGNDSVYTACNMIFGEAGSKALLVFIVISVLGTLNGLIIGSIRQPYSLAIRNLIPGASTLSQESKKLNGMPVNSGVLSLLIAIAWLVVHYFTLEAGMQGDVSEIAVSVSYLNYCVLYYVVFKLARKGEIKNKFMGYVVPVMATLGSFIIVLGAASNKYFPIYLAICFAVMGVGYYFGAKSMNGANVIEVEMES